MKHRYRILALLLALVMALGLLCGCGTTAPELPDDPSAPIVDPSGPEQTLPEKPEPLPAPDPEPQPTEDPLPEPQQPEKPEQPEKPGTPEQPQKPEKPEKPQKPAIDEDGAYTSKEDVALYIHTYGRLPDNFITKKQARAAGWEGGPVERWCPGKCIGGDRFGNYEGLLPDAKGRVWTECDIDTLGGAPRGAKRIVFSNDGLIYYTPDHYESFELLYDNGR